LHAPEAAPGEGRRRTADRLLRSGQRPTERHQRAQEDEAPCDTACRRHRLPWMPAPRSGYFAPSIARSAVIASATCLVAWNCELNTCRTTPCRSTTKVTRPGRRPSVADPPYCLHTVPPRSASSTYGSRYFVTNFSVAASPSELT